MANIVDYLAAKAALPEVLAVGTHELVDEDSGGVALCQAPLTEVNAGGTAAVRKTLKFYVTDYGGGGETVYEFRRDFEPELTPAEKFADIVLNWIYSTSVANVAEIVSLDEVRKKCRLKLYIQTSGTEYEVKDAIAWKPNGMPPEIRYLPTT